MASTYVDLLAKLQSQSLDALKTAQDAHVATLTSIREVVEKLPALPSVPTVEGMPSFKELADLNASFAGAVIEQQKAYATQIADAFAPLLKR
ncbi:MAG: hypothetical protein ABR591_05800 [Candidatus Velthaea sp.]